MRLFIAINFNENIKDKLYDQIKTLKSYTIQGSFTHRDNLHLTLIFLGEVVHNRVDSLKQAMAQVTREPFILTMGGLGSFKRNDGDIYWIGIDRNEELFSIHKQLSKELILRGFSIEKREYKPHLTLGRKMILSPNFTEVGFLKRIPSIKTKISKISLMKSERINGKLTYTEIYEKQLGV